MSQHHDPVHPDSDHLSAETIADLDLDLLDGESAAHALRHIERCAECAALRADLVALTVALSDLPTPDMPDEVWAQLSARLSAEPVSTPTGAATVVPLGNRRRRRGRPGMGVVAGAAGVALLGAIIVPSFLGGSGDDGSTLAGAGGSTADRAEETVPMSAYAATRSGTKYQQEELPEQVTQLVAARSTFTPEPEVTDMASPEVTDGTSPTALPSPTESGDAAPMATDPAAAQACLEGYLGVVGVEPLAIDIGVWQGEPAAVIVLPADEPELAAVWVIDPGCSTGIDDPLLHYAVVSR